MRRWDTPGVPHKGWFCRDTIDLGDGLSPDEEIPYETCEMCGNERVRYVHVMGHASHGDLRVGCVCASHMSEQPVGVYNERERSLRNKASARKRWRTRKWKRSAKGNLYLKLGDLVVTIMASRFHAGKWIYLIDKKSSKPYPSEEAAKLGAFDEVWVLTGREMGRQMEGRTQFDDW